LVTRIAADCLVSWRRRLAGGFLYWRSRAKPPAGRRRHQTFSAHSTLAKSEVHLQAPRMKNHLKFQENANPKHSNLFDTKRPRVVSLITAKFRLALRFLQQLGLGKSRIFRPRGVP
jgi:hypothetical protein